MTALHDPFWPPDLPRELPLAHESLWRTFESSVRRDPAHPCLVFYDRVWSYGEVARECERLAGFLQQRCGVRIGDRVALCMQNSPHFVIAFYAILRADAMVVPVNVMNVTGELAHLLADSGARVVIASQDLYPKFAPLAGKAFDRAVIGCYADYLGAGGGEVAWQIPENISAPRQRLAGPGVALWNDALAEGIEPEAHRATQDDYCVLAYTSGTTGEPKGAVHRHRSVFHTAACVARWHHVGAGERILAILPLFHVTGMQNSMNMPLQAGASIVLLPRWNRDVAAALVHHHRVTGITAVPAMIVDLISSPDLERYDFSSLRVIGGGGAAMPEAVARKLQALCGLTYMEGYGLTETMAPTHSNPSQRPKEQCLGIPTFNTEAHIVDPGTLREMPQGEVGEIVVSGPQVFDGYWNNPEASAAAFIVLGGRRFFRTGDLGRIDADGYYFFVDRLKRMINVAGFKVWPAEVEAQLYGHPGVQEAVVIARKDERSGESVKALIVLRPQARGAVSAEQLTAWARERMAAFKVPRDIEFVESLPKSATGKINWRALQEREYAGG